MVAMASRWKHLRWTFLLTYLMAILFGCPASGQEVCPGDANSTVTCPVYPKCQNNCGLTYADGAIDCSCDELCRIYGDCCLDFEEHCPKTAKKGLEITPRFTAGGKCRTIHHRYYPSMSYLAKCDPAWPEDDNIQELCMDETSSLLSLVPVTDVTTSLSYSNIYCARCNYLRMENVVRWEGDMRCFKDLPENATAEQFLKYIKMGACSVAFFSWPDGVTLHRRKCSHFLRDECEQDDCSEELSDKCRGPLWKPVLRRIGLGKFYKNEFCAICSGHEASKLQCVENLLFTAGQHLPPLGSFSFSVLANIDQSSAQFSSISHNTTLCYGNETETSGSCNATNVSNVKDGNYLLAKSESDEWLGILSLVCISASILCLVVRLSLQIPVQSYHNLAGKTQFAFSVSLLLALMAFLGGPFATGTKEMCRYLSILMHWAFLASFFWMNVTAFDMWRVFRPNSVPNRSLADQKKLFLSFCMYAWLVPLAIVLAAYSLDLAQIDSELRPYYGNDLCWITQKYSLILFFGAPLAFIVVTNTVLYATTSYNVRVAMKMTAIVRSEDKETFGYRFGVFVKLFVLMGMTWVSAFVAALVGNDVMWGVYTVLTATQGMYVSLATICTRHVRKDIFGEKSDSSSKSPKPVQGEVNKAGPS